MFIFRFKLENKLVLAEKELQQARKDNHVVTPPPSCMTEVGSSSHRRTALPLSCQEEASSNDSVVEMWVVAPLTSTRLEEASSDDSPSTSSGYNGECLYIKEVSSYELLLDFNCLV
jgi:hypothetical protein